MMRTPDLLECRGDRQAIPPSRQKRFPSVSWFRAMATSDAERDKILSQFMDHQASKTFAVDVVQRLVDAGYTAYWAGGCVRDLLMGHLPTDYDVATNARPDQVRELFGKRRTLAVGESFGVIVVLSPGKTIEQIEVATFRADGPYSDGRRPDEIAYSSPELDAQRRDFTINGMFFDPLQQELIDFVGGQQDLEQKVVRAIGDPAARIQEDKLRMLRAVRFTARFDFALDPSTAAAVQSLSAELNVVSQERITEELRKMLRHASRSQAVRMLQQLDLLVQIVPELSLCWQEPPFAEQTLRMLAEQNSNSFELSLAILLRQFADLHNSGLSLNGNSPITSICLNLKLSNQERDNVTWLIENLKTMGQAPQLPLHQLKTMLAHPLHMQLLEFAEVADRAAERSAAATEFCRDYLANTPPEIIAPPPLLTGKDLIAQGLRPGKDFSRLLNAIRVAQLDEQISTSAEALEWMRRLQSEGKSD
jgi:poly(A) polymerase